MTPLLRSSLLFLCLSWLTLAFSVRAAAAPAPSAGWTYDWRPGWLPGDPEEPGFRLFAAPWETAGFAAPGMLVYLDPITRLPVRPSPEQRRALSAVLLRARPDVPLPTERIPGGGELLHLPEGFQVFIMARRNAQGGYEIDCATEPQGRGPAESRPAEPPPPREER